MNTFCTFLIASCTIFFVAGPASAEIKNPQMRICNQLSGVYYEAGNEVDLYGFCAFDKSSVGTLDLMRFFHQAESVTTLQTYINHVRSCEPFGQITPLTPTDGETEIFCLFADGSMIDSKTLATGISDARNVKLNTALGLSN